MLVAGLVLVVGCAVPAVAEDCAPDAAVASERPQTSGASALVRDLDLAALHALVPASDVGVAVLDTGIVADDPRIVVAGAASFAATPAIESWHGTQVAGVIGGRQVDDAEPALGVAPGVRLFDVQVADALDVGEDDARRRAASAESVAAGLRWVVENAASEGIRVVNVSLGVREDPAGLVEVQVRALDELDVLVVAAQSDAVADAAPLGPGAVGSPETPVLPAAIDLPWVLAVGASPQPEQGAAGTNQPSRRTDVVAPSGAITLGPLGGSCVVGASAAYAAASVSGLAALMFAHDRETNAREVRARIVETAGGVTDASNLYAGAGTIQPWEALTREVEVGADGRVVRSDAVPRALVEAAAPRVPADALAASRDEVLWWGLLGGLGIGLALLLGVARRRETDTSAES